jgi:hypothetical protein
LAHWSLVEADLHDRYGLDCEDHHLLASRSWRWFRTRVVQLLSLPPTIVPLHPDTQRPPLVVPATRIGLALDPPNTD